MKNIIIVLLLMLSYTAFAQNLLDLDYPYRNSKGVIDYRYYKVNETKVPYASRKDVINTVPTSERAKGRRFMIKVGSDTSEYVFYHGTAYANLLKVDSLYSGGATIYTSDGTITSLNKERKVLMCDTCNLFITNPATDSYKGGVLIGANFLDAGMTRKWTTGGIDNNGSSLYIRNNGGMVFQSSNSGNSIFMGDNISIGNNTFQNFYNIVGNNFVNLENSPYRSYFGNDAYTEGNITFASYARQSNGFFNASFAQTPYWYRSLGSLLIGNNPVDSLCYGCIVASTPKTTSLEKDTLSSTRVVGKGSVIYGAVNLSGNTNSRSNKYNAVSSSYSGALLGINHNLPSNTPNSVIIGGNTINVSAGDSNTVYLPKVKIGKGLNAPITQNDSSKYVATYNYDGALGKTLRSSLNLNTGVSFAPAYNFNASFVVMASAIFRPNNAYVSGDTIKWQLIGSSSQHNSTFINSAISDVSSASLVYSYPNVKNVLDLSVTTDEAFASAGVFVGASVGVNSATISAYTNMPGGVRLKGQGTTSWSVNGTNSIYTFNSITSGITGFNITSNIYDYNSLQINYIGVNNYGVRRIYSGLGAYNAGFVLVDRATGLDVTSAPTAYDEVIISGGGTRNLQFGLARYNTLNKFIAGPSSQYNFWTLGIFECWMIANATSATSIKIRWQPYPSATSYKIYRDISSSFTSPTLIYTGTLKEYLDTGLTPSTQYYYKMVATVAGVDTDITTFNTNTNSL